MSIEENLITIRNEILNIQKECNRENDKVELLAVSKTKPIDYLLEAYNSGQRLFGENRINEAEIKVPALPNDAIFHMIGHLQSNKVKKACELFDCIQSVDSLKVAKKIDKYCKELKKTMDIYLEINIVNDINKNGFKPSDDLINIAKEITTLTNINIVGLMCIGAHVSDEQQIKKSFLSLKELSEKLNNEIPEFNGTKLSMGMSGDYKLAIESGSSMVRVGSSIFGVRV